jgi:hypothetical protein
LKLSYDALTLAPKKSGVYYFYDSAGKLLYIGRAKNIRERLRHHLATYELVQLFLAHHDLWWRSIGPVIDRVLLQVSEVRYERLEFHEAVKREKELVSSLNPPFNAEFRTTPPSQEYILASRIPDWEEKQIEKHYRELFDSDSSSSS